MALNIKNARTHAMAARLAAATGESITEAVTKAIEERLQRVERRPDPEYVAREVQRIQQWFREQPIRDPRPGDEILYDEDGLPH